jgi:hypothetical protein
MTSEVHKPMSGHYDGDNDRYSGGCVVVGGNVD